MNDTQSNDVDLFFSSFYWISRFKEQPNEIPNLLLMGEMTVHSGSTEKQIKFKESPLIVGLFEIKISDNYIIYLKIAQIKNVIDCSQIKQVICKTDDNCNILQLVLPNIILSFKPHNKIVKSPFNSLQQILKLNVKETEKYRKRKREIDDDIIILKKPHLEDQTNISILREQNYSWLNHIAIINSFAQKISSTSVDDSMLQDDWRLLYSSSVSSLTNRDKLNELKLKIADENELLLRREAELLDILFPLKIPSDSEISTEVKDKAEIELSNLQKRDSFESALLIDMIPNRSQDLIKKFLVTMSKQTGDMCLSMHQPWASLLVYGIKRLEGRSWHSDYKGRLWIHAASKKPEPELIKEIESNYHQLLKEYSGSEQSQINFPQFYPTSHLIGCVDVVDCIANDKLDKIRLGNQDNSVDIFSQFLDLKKPFYFEPNDSEFCFVCINPQRLVVPFAMTGDHKLWRIPKKTLQNATAGLKPIQHSS